MRSGIRTAPWGQRKVIYNAMGYNIPRGYTMHEHLDEFGLLNTGARLYDPYLARFLSPDPYIQAPENSQNFNRYSYCLNNPLKYTDPSGEFWLELGIAIGFGALVNGMDAMASGGKFWDGAWRGAITGAISAGAGMGVDALTKGFVAIGAIPGAFSQGMIDGLAGGISGGLSSLVTGQKFITGFWQGAAWGGLSGAVKGGIKGYKTGNSILQDESFYGSAITGRIYTNERTYTAFLKTGVSLQLDPSKYCYAYSLEYADAGHGNTKAEVYINAADGAEGADARQVALKLGHCVWSSVDRKPLKCESLEAFANNLGTNELFFCPNRHWMNITSITLADKVKVSNISLRTAVKTMSIWDPIRGHVSDVLYPIINAGILTY